MMTPEEIIETITARLPGVRPKSSWGETALFYNPGGVLPNGVYFCTIKTHDGENDKASNLNREGVYRVSIGVGKAAYERLLGKRPARPLKGGVIAGAYDFAALDVLMPHPIYAWMGWAQVLLPSQATFEKILPLIDTAHALAVQKFEKKVQK
jgi:hypothetical protein